MCYIYVTLQGRWYHRLATIQLQKGKVSSNQGNNYEKTSLHCIQICSKCPILLYLYMKYTSLKECYAMKCDSGSLFELIFYKCNHNHITNLINCHAWKQYIMYSQFCLWFIRVVLPYQKLRWYVQSVSTTYLSISYDDVLNSSHPHREKTVWVDCASSSLRQWYFSCC